MDKLIITILGIALSAATILWTSDYLSSLYTNAQSTTRAQKWIADAGQIAVAARQAGNLAVVSDNWQQGASAGVVASALIPAYLSDLPKHSGVYVFIPCATITGTGTTGTFCPSYSEADGNVASGVSLLEAKVENAKVCTEIQKMAARGATTLSTITVDSSGTLFPFALAAPILAVNSNKQFTCVTDGAGNYYFFYRVFMDR